MEQEVDDVLDTTEPESWTQHRRDPTPAWDVIRCCLGSVLSLGLIFGVGHLINQSGLLSPVYDALEPARQLDEQLKGWIAADPQRIWTAAVAVIIFHLGLVYCLVRDYR